MMSNQDKSSGLLFVAVAGAVAVHADAVAVGAAVGSIGACGLAGRHSTQHHADCGTKYKSPLHDSDDKKLKR